MCTRAFVGGMIFGVLLCACFTPSALAQGTSAASIAGVVKDSSGAVIPGVSVEAASPSLIEKFKAAVTDNQGQYRIIDLRPGTYTVTASLSGFHTFKREGLDLPSSFTATVNVVLELGSIEETVTVSQSAPLVEGTGRGFFANPLGAQEIVIDIGTMGSAEYSLGGAQVNMISKSGGNRLSGSWFTGLTGHQLQSNNLTDTLKTQGLTSVNGVRRVWDYNVAFGGPIVKDKLWFFTADRWWGVNRPTSTSTTC